MTNFKCFVCYTVVGEIPYCAGCEIGLPNSCKVSSVKQKTKTKTEYEYIFQVRHRNKSFAKRGKFKNLNKDYFNGDKILLGITHEGFRVYVGDTCEVTYSFVKRSILLNITTNEDDDLLNCFENRKAASIIKIIHSGISKKKKKDAFGTKRIRNQLTGIQKQRAKIEIFNRDGCRCLKCGTNNNLTLDHIKPLCGGGTNDYSNLQTLCGDCNGSKGARIIDYRNAEERLKYAT